MTEACPDCKPKGEFTLDGEVYPSYIALCPRHDELAKAYEAGRRYEYDKMHGEGAWDREQQSKDAYT